MTFTWYSGSYPDVQVGTRICGLTKQNKRPFKIELERSDIKELLALPPEQLRPYLKMLMNGLADDN